MAAIFLGVQAWQSRGVVRGAAPHIAGRGLRGEALDTAALRGRPALVTFWATWCTVCRADLGTLASVARDVPMITVASSSGDAAEVRAWLAARGRELPVIVDPGGTIAAAAGVHAFPTTLVLDAGGRVRSVAVGYTTEAGLRARLALAR